MSISIFTSFDPAEIQTRVYRYSSIHSIHSAAGGAAGRGRALFG